MADKKVAQEEKEAKRISEQAMINENYFDGLLWSNPTVYYADYSNTIEAEHLIHGVWRFFYDLGRRMYNDGVKKFDPITIQMKVKEYNVEKEFDKYGGLDTMEDSISLVKANSENIAYYAEKIEKNYIIRQLYDTFGSKVFKKQGKYDYTKLSKEQLVTYWQDKVNKISLTTTTGYEVENLIIDAEEFIRSIEEDAENMLPFHKSNMMNSITQGIAQGHVMMIGAFGNSGKAVDSETSIPTPRGWVKAKEIKLGDTIFDRKGNPTKVIGVFPQGIIDANKVTLNDGRSFIANDEHIVPYISHGKKFKILDKTLKEMKEDYVGVYNHNNEDKKYHKYRIPNNETVEYPEKDLPIDPYALGVLIGDGALTVQSLTISSNELDVVDKASKRLGLITPTKSIWNYNYVFKAEDGKRKEIMNKIADLKLNVKSIYRFIPEEYQLASSGQRMELLQGLMDTDGRVSLSPKKSLAFHFSTNSKVLAEDVTLLAHSLGIGATMKVSQRENKINDEYVVMMYTSKKIVTSKKHTEKFEEAKNFSHRDKYAKIVNIEEVSDRDMVCFMVDNDEHLFLINDYIVTHNSSMIADKIVMSYIANNEKAIVVLNEESANSFRQKIVLSILNHEVAGAKGFNRKHMTNGQLEESDKEQIRMAFAKMRELTEGEDAIIKIIFMSKYDMDDLERLVRYHANRGYHNLLIDTHKVSDNSRQDQRWATFVEDMKKIYRFTRKEAGGCNLRTVVTFQLADSHIRDRFLTADAMAEGKASKNEASVVMMFRPMFSDEYDGEKRALKCHRWRKKTEDEMMLNPKDKKKFAKEEIPLEKGKVYYLLFTPKNRFGNNTDNGQEVLVLEPNFNFNSFNEIGWTYVDKDFS